MTAIHDVISEIERRLTRHSVRLRESLLKRARVVVCEQCAKEFVAFDSRARFCSNSCRVRASRQRKKLSSAEAT